MSDVFTNNDKPIVIKFKELHTSSKLMEDLHSQTFKLMVRIGFWDLEGEYPTISIYGIDDHKIGQNFFKNHSYLIEDMTWFTDSDEGGHFFARIHDGKYEICGIIPDGEWTDA